MHVVPRQDRAASEKAARTAARAPESDPKPTAAATAGKRGTGHANTAAAPDATATTATRPKAVKERLFAHPQRAAAYSAGGQRQLSTAPPATSSRPVADGALGQYLARPYALRVNQVALQPLKKGSRVIAGTILGRVGRTSLRWNTKTHVRFEIRPSGASRAAHRPDADPRRLEAPGLHAPLPRHRPPAWAAAPMPRSGRSC